MSAEREQRRTKAGALRARRGESGITLLLVLFLAALMIIAASVAVPNLILQERRQQEKLMIWRGRQYARAIGLYYRKTGHFPHNLKELEKGVAGLHFLRKAYTDPMSSDGSWRLIYLGAGGQLTGSLCWRTLAEYQAAEMGVPIANAGKTSGTTSGQSSSLFDSGTGQSKEPAVPTCQMIGQNNSNSLSVQTITEGDMVGGNLIGVGGVADTSSVKHYMGADNYKYWEFIWAPQKGQKLSLGSKPASGSGKSGSSKKPTKPTKPGSSPANSSPTNTSPTPPSGNNQSPSS